MGNNVYYADGAPGGQQYQPKSNPKKGLLAAGLTINAAAFAAVATSAIIFFVPGISFGGAAFSVFTLCTVLDGLGAALAFFGTVFSVAGANSRKSIAKLSFFFGITAFLLGGALLLIALFFKTILPLNAVAAAILF